MNLKYTYWFFKSVLSDEFCKTMSEKTESKSSKFLATQKMIEELQDKTAETIRKDREKMLALTTNIYIDMVKDKTVEGYHKQISNNMMVGIKATYFVCRDLHDAKQSLNEKEFKVNEDHVSLINNEHEMMPNGFHFVPDPVIYESDIEEGVL